MVGGGRRGGGGGGGGGYRGVLEEVGEQGEAETACCAGYGDVVVMHDCSEADRRETAGWTRVAEADGFLRSAEGYNA